MPGGWTGGGLLPDSCPPHPEMKSGKRRPEIPNNRCLRKDPISDIFSKVSSLVPLLRAHSPEIQKLWTGNFSVTISESLFRLPTQAEQSIAGVIAPKPRSSAVFMSGKIAY